MLTRFFKLAEAGTTPGREIQAGFTTFAAMAYILAVNPAILADAHMPRAALVTVTALTAALSTALMALLTNFPLALAPGMGINAYFTYSVCLGLGVPWQSALGLVFINGVIFLALSLTGVREKIIEAIPYSLKMAVTAGIGLFIAFIGLKNGGLIVGHPATFVSHGNLGSPPVLLCFAGLLLAAVLVARQVTGGIIIAILAVTVIGLFVPNGAGATVTSLPARLVDMPASPVPTFLQLNFDLVRTDLLKALPIILTLLLVDMFDNIGTLIGVTQRAGLLGPDGKLPKAGRALVADSTAAILSSLLGTSTVVSYIESAAGVSAGGRTGLTALTTAACFLLALVFTPLILAIPAVATAPALVIVGMLMFQSVANINLKDFHEAAPAFMIILGMPLTFSIAEGLGFGLITCSLVWLATGRGRQAPVLLYILAGVFSLHFVRDLLAKLL